MGLFDVHAHLTHDRFDSDCAEVIQRARRAGVTSIVCNGLNISDNAKVLALSQQYPEIRPALGLYPVDAVLPEMLAAGVDYPREDATINSAEETIEYLTGHAPQAFAIGEIGLDHYWVPEAFWRRQEDVFRALLTIAKDADLPVIIHTRKAEQRAFDILVEMQVSRVNWHCFSSKLKLARRIADAGHFLSIPSNARRSETFTGMLRSLPRDRLLLETDCPYLARESGMRSEPAHVSGTAAYAAELWGSDEAATRAQFEANFVALFGSAP